MRTRSALEMERAACRAIIALAIQQRRAQGSLWLTWLLLGLAVMFCLLAIPAAFSDARMMRGALVGAGIMFGMLSALWWTLLIGSLTAQYSAFAARLVPRARQRMSAVLAAGWLVVALLSTGLIGLPLGHPVAVFLAAIFIMAQVVLAGTWRGTVGMAFFVASMLGFEVPPAVFEALDGPVGELAVIAVVVIEARNAFVRIFGKPGGLPPARPRGLAQCSPQTASGPVLAPASHAGLVLFGLGPVPPWRLCLRSFAMWAGASAVFWLVIFRAEWGMLAARALVLALLLLSQFTAADAMVAMVYRSSREQALLRLVPAAPDSRNLNRVLAGALLKPLAGMWLLSIAAGMLTFLVTGASWAHALESMAVFALAPFAVTCLLADYSAPRRTGLAVMLGWLVAGAAGFVMVLVVAFDHAQPRTVAGAAALLLATGGTFALMRWHAMLRAPAAFPVGRAG